VIVYYIWKKLPIKWSSLIAKTENFFPPLLDVPQFKIQFLSLKKKKRNEIIKKAFKDKNWKLDFLVLFAESERADTIKEGQKNQFNEFSKLVNGFKNVTLLTMYL